MIVDRPLGQGDLTGDPAQPVTGYTLMRLISNVLQPLWSQAANAVTGGPGVVTATQAGPPATVSVLVDGVTYTARYLASYTPVVGNAVLVLHNVSQALVVGKLA